MLTGLIDGEVLDDRKLALSANHRDRVWVGDVDDQGIMLIGAGTERISVTFVRFPQPADSPAGIADAVAALA